MSSTAGLERGAGGEALASGRAVPAVGQMVARPADAACHVTACGRCQTTGHHFWTMVCSNLGFLSASVVKNPPATQEMQGTWVRSLGQEDPLKKGTATHSSILACRIPRTEEAGGLPSVGSQGSDTTE